MTCVGAPKFIRIARNVVPINAPGESLVLVYRECAEIDFLSLQEWRRNYNDVMSFRVSVQLLEDGRIVQ